VNDITLIVPYYRNILMLKRQSDEWNSYPPGLKIIVVDDCSPEPAEPLVMRRDITVLRISDNIQWNRNGARNLGAQVADSRWIMQIDIDHLLPARCAYELMKQPLDPTNLYRFCRWRRGMADETRKKDLLPREQEYGRIKPHGDSYLVERCAYWKVGGYDEDYSGHLGGGSPFLAQLEKVRRPWVLPSDIFLEVYTRSECQDASDNTLSRDTSHYSALRRSKERYDRTASVNPIRFNWSKIQ
jgi:glycosyltransferase involved in cell wall biosynthesis